MLFNSAEFLIFFPVVVAIYFVIPHRFRWMILLAASYYFYMCWKAEYVVLLAASTLVDYYAGLKMGAIPGRSNSPRSGDESPERNTQPPDGCQSPPDFQHSILGSGRSPRRSGRRKYLYLSLLVNLSILFGFKYYNFVNDNLRQALEQVNIFYDVPSFQVLLPVGISFYTFQSLGYTIDVYRGNTEPERHLGRFALYVSFFPQLVAGPIERASNFLPQLREIVGFQYDRVVAGLRQMLWGFFKKIVIADRLAIYVNEVYDHPGEYHGAPVVAATVFFAFQIYCDFSAYSDIAIGAARVLGFRLMENFDRPYQATSIADFWRRWHISLSTWFRDYVYIPLGGNRVATGRCQFNLMVTFLLSGLWHGASWTFVVWGALHGFYMIAGRSLKPWRTRCAATLGLDRVPAVSSGLRVVLTFFLVCLAWVFFRAETLTDAMLLISNSCLLSDGGWDLYVINKHDLNLAFLSLAVLCAVEVLQGSETVAELLAGGSWPRRWGIYYALTASILYLGRYEAQEFLYFQF